MLPRGLATAAFTDAPMLMRRCFAAKGPLLQQGRAPVQFLDPLLGLDARRSGSEGNAGLFGQHEDASPDPRSSPHAAPRALPLHAATCAPARDR